MGVAVSEGDGVAVGVGAAVAVGAEVGREVGVETGDTKTTVPIGVGDARGEAKVVSGVAASGVSSVESSMVVVPVAKGSTGRGDSNVVPAAVAVASTATGESSVASAVSSRDGGESAPASVGVWAGVPARTGEWRPSASTANGMTTAAQTARAIGHLGMPNTSLMVQPNRTGSVRYPAQPGHRGPEQQRQVSIAPAAAAGESPHGKSSGLGGVEEFSAGEEGVEASEVPGREESGKGGFGGGAFGRACATADLARHHLRPDCPLGGVVV